MISSFSKGHIDTIIKVENKTWRFTEFYGNLEAGKRMDSWKLMERFNEAINLPWITGGDFNEILLEKEKEEGNPKDPNLMNSFTEVIDKCSLRDIGYVGNLFTWRRGKQAAKGIREHLDRFVVNPDFDQKFQSLKVLDLSFHTFDHMPIVAIIESNPQKRKRNPNRPLKFEEPWTTFPESKEIIKERWNRDQGRDVEAFARKISSCLEGLALWNKERLGGSISKVVDQKLKQIKDIELQDSGFPSQSLMKAERELEMLFEEEEKFWKIRSREDWLKWGDKSTKWFHNKASQRRKRNEIVGLVSRERIWEEDEEKIGYIAFSYFKDLFASSNPSNDRLEFTFKGIDKALSDRDNKNLTSAFTKA